MGLREHLRRETRELHQRTEELLGCLDIRDPAGLDRFLLVHHAAVMPIERRLATATMGPRWPFRLTDLLAQDLAARGLAATPGIEASRFDGAHPLGLCYVLGGSRLGARFLLRRLNGAEPVPQYLSRAPDDAIWSWTLAQLNAPEADSAPRDAIVTAAEAAFAGFADALTLVGAAKETIDELAV